MLKKKRSAGDRRSGVDRGSHHELAKRYFADSKTDPRKGSERRSGVERRSGWVKINEWSIVEAGKLKKIT